MAHPTAEQASVLRQLHVQHGPPNETKIEHTGEPYGLIWCHWGNAVPFGYELLDRNLFIRPDGSRLSWDTTHYTERLIPDADH